MANAKRSPHDRALLELPSPRKQSKIYLPPDDNRYILSASSGNEETNELLCIAIMIFQCIVLTHDGAVLFSRANEDLENYDPETGHDFYFLHHVLAFFSPWTTWDERYTALTPINNANELVYADDYGVDHPYTVYLILNFVRNGLDQEWQRNHSLLKLIHGSWWDMCTQWRQIPIRIYDLEAYLFLENRSSLRDTSAFSYEIVHPIRTTIFGIKGNFDHPDFHYTQERRTNNRVPNATDANASRHPLLTTSRKISTLGG